MLVIDDTTNFRWFWLEFQRIHKFSPILALTLLYIMNVVDSIDWMGVDKDVITWFKYESTYILD